MGFHFHDFVWSSNTQYHHQPLFFSLVLEKGRRDTGRRGEREPSNLNEPQLLQSVLNMLVK